MTCKLLAVLMAFLTWLPGEMLPDDPVESVAAFAKLKTLEGSWVSAEGPLPDRPTAAQAGSQATTRFELTANGTVLVEHYSNPALPGGGHMMTAYHLDGRDLVLTHYCIAANQPTLRAARWDAARGELQFEFVRAANLSSAGAGHMRRAKYRFEGPDRFTTEWEFFENGRLKMTEVETFSRVR